MAISVDAPSGSSERESANSCTAHLSRVATLSTAGTAASNVSKLRAPTRPQNQCSAARAQIASLWQHQQTKVGTSYAHTRTRAHARTRTRAHAHTRTRAHARTRTRTRTRAHCCAVCRDSTSWV
eukprot:2625862-Prymnesium_polylepis.2